LYPHYIRPVPAMSVVHLPLDPKQSLTTSLTVPRGSALLSTRINGTYCKFRTTYDVTMCQIEVKDCSWQSAEGFSNLGPAMSEEFRRDAPFAVLRVKLACSSNDLAVSKLPLQTLVFYLSGESNIANALYELLLQNCVAVIARGGNGKDGTEPILVKKAN